MKKKLNKKTLCLTAAALTLTAGLSVGSAMAYFTTYVTAQGGQELSLGFTEVIPDEEVSDWTKHIKIENTGDYSIRKDWSTPMRVENGRREMTDIITILML